MNWFEEAGGDGGSCVSGFRQKCGRGSAGSDNDEAGYGDGSCIRITSDKVPDLALCFNTFQHCQNLCLRALLAKPRAQQILAKCLPFSSAHITQCHFSTG